MKANEAPYRLYFGESDKGILDIYSNKESNDEIEYIRTDAFMKKAVQFLKDKGSAYIAIIDGQLILRKDVVKDFRKYMEGE